ncbi:MAG TPA: right-handed parallel beta-helix repeat-containing protein, partial [Kiritimatiellia bacterium]|nr:right-handed parallel beta-helix repeat-containing protein [Kiritimatiellia bacterium]
MKTQRIGFNGVVTRFMAAVAAGVLGVVAAGAATLQVGPGQTYTTIQAAINAANAGDTIIVAAGTYVEQVSLQKALTLQGANAGVSAGAVPGTRTAETIVDGGFYIQVSAHGAVIDGFTIQNGYQYGGHKNGIGVGGQAGAVTDVKIQNNIIKEVGGSQSQGVEVVAGCNNLLLKNNEIVNNWRGVYLNAASGVTVEGNSIHANNGVGVGIGSSGQVAISVVGNAIYDHTVEGWGMDTLGAGSVATNNAFYNNTVSIGHYSGAPLDATLNYWGSDAGPGTSSVTGNVDADPYWQDVAMTILGSDSPVQNVTQGLFYNAIQAAVTAAASGDRITVAAGTYVENVYVDKDLDIVGAGAAATIVDGNDAGSVFYVDGDIDVVIEGLTIQNGGGVAATYGAGVYAEASSVGLSLSLVDCVVEDNTAVYAGGGLATGGWGEYVTLIGTTISGNTASGTGPGTGGGGVFVYGGELTMENCTVSGNTATRFGGGIYLAGEATCQIDFATVTGNTAGQGGGLSLIGATGAIKNTIICGNTDQFSGTATDNVNGTIPGDTNNLRDQDAMLGALAGNGGPTPTHALLAGSPAINNGAAGTITYDQRGVPRDQGNAPDIGAYETVRIVYVDDDWTGPENVVGHVWGKDAFGTINAAIAAVPEGGVVNVAAGTYGEALVLSKPFSLVGAGDQDGGSRLEAATHAITVNSGTMSDSLRLSIAGFYVLSTGGSAVNLNTGAQYVDIDDCTLASALKVGVRAGSAANIAHLRFTDLTFAGNLQDVYFSNETLGNNSDADDITFERCVFTGLQKGIYVEKLSNAIIRDCMFTGVGSDATYAWGAAIDLNLKWDDFANILIEDCSFTDCGLGSREGMAIGIKARGTGTDTGYAADAATLSGVTIQNCTITGCERGIRIGEPGKSNTGPTDVTIVNNVLDNNVQAYTGTDGSAYGDVVNAITAPLVADGNYWGEATPNMAEHVAGDVTVDTYYAAYDAGTGVFSDLNVLTVYVDGTLVTEDATHFKTLAGAVAAVAPGGTVHVAAGTYNESVTLAQPVSLVGPASGDKPLVVGMITATHTTGWATRIENINFKVNTADKNNLKLVGVKNLTVKGCDFDADERFMTPQQVVAVQLDGACQNITFDACTFHDGYYVTIQGRADNLLVKACTLENVKSGINIQYAYGTGLILQNTDISVVAQGTANDTYCVRFGSGSGTAQNLNISGGTFTVDENGLTPDAGTYFHAIIVREAASGTLAVTGTTINGEIANLSATPLAGVDNQYYVVYVDDGYTAATSGWGQYAFASIQDAVNAVQANGKIAVAAGTYTQSVTVSKPLDLVAVGEATLVGTATDAVTVAADGVSISGFTIQNSNGLHGIYALN